MGCYTSKYPIPDPEMYILPIRSFNLFNTSYDIPSGGFLPTQCSFVKPPFDCMRMSAMGSSFPQECIQRRIRIHADNENCELIPREYSIIYCPMYCLTRSETWPRDLRVLSDTSSILEVDFLDIIQTVRNVYDMDTGLLQVAQFLNSWRGKCKTIERTVIIYEDVPRNINTGINQ